LVSRELHPLCTLFYRTYGVFPGSVVVSKGTGMPSKGYFAFLRSLGINYLSERALWKRELSKFYSFCEVAYGHFPLFHSLLDFNRPLPQVPGWKPEEG
jgi:hypothetical protein